MYVSQYFVLLKYSVTMYLYAHNNVMNKDFQIYATSCIYVVVVERHLEFVEEQPLASFVFVQVVIEVPRRVAERVEPADRVEQQRGRRLLVDDTGVTAVPSAHHVDGAARVTHERERVAAQRRAEVHRHDDEVTPRGQAAVVRPRTRIVGDRRRGIGRHRQRRQLTADVSRNPGLKSTSLAGRARYFCRSFDEPVDADGSFRRSGHLR